MPTRWRPPDGCWQCEQAALAIPPAIEREQRRLELGIGPAPAELTVRTHDGGVIRYAVPRRLRPRGR